VAGVEAAANNAAPSAAKAAGFDDTAGFSNNHEDVARRAYERFERRGRGHGRDQEDWYEAEREGRRHR
jgi:hypothetical protein